MGSSPVVYRYVDWSITVPLQMIEFNLILKAAGKPCSSGQFWRLFLGTVMMLSFGYCGEIGVMVAWPAFAGGLCGWFFILFEIFAGEAGGQAGDCSAAVTASFNNMRMIVTVGWAIYPAGYLFGYLLGTVDQVFLNVIYNIADFVNKIAFVLACWSLFSQVFECCVRFICKDRMPPFRCYDVLRCILLSIQRNFPVAILSRHLG